MRFGRHRKRSEIKGTLHLDRWIAFHAARRTKLASLLSSRPKTPELREELQSWRKNLQTKRAWLQARLDHVKALDEVLEGLIDEGKPPQTDK